MLIRFPQKGMSWEDYGVLQRGCMEALRDGRMVEAYSYQISMLEAQAPGQIELYFPWSLENIRNKVTEC